MRLLPASVLVCSAIAVPPLGLLIGLYALNLSPGPLELALGLVASAGVSGLIAFFASRHFLMHIRRVLSAMLRIAQGERGTQIPVEGKSELGELAHALNYMSLEVKAFDDSQKQLVAQMKQGCLETVRALVSAIHARDPYTRGHANRVSRLGVLVGKEFGLSEDDLLALEYGGILHDVGKIGIRDHILLKPAQLTTEEMEIMRSHPEHGRRILSGVSFLKPVLPIVYHHHEWWDGKGYPHGLAGDDIPLGARIIAVVDTYDALVTDRPYQKGRTPTEAKVVLEKLRGRHFDPKVLDALYAVIARRQADRVAEETPGDTSGERQQTPHEIILAEEALGPQPAVPQKAPSN
ncbi:MAG: HD domain-containing protein [Deltaproteobacteria bacterium]|nr:HD domain-containing protein [Deltaproteobacteria bacterium]